MKRMIAFVFLILCFLVAGTSCDIDPYAGERPCDYEGSVWMFQNEEYEICYNVEDVTQSYYQKDGGEKRRISFLWSEYYAHVIVHEYDENGEKVTLLSGNCEFNKKWFSIALDYDASPRELLREIRFERVK